jgi:CMP-N-acetylneuraminic acid synthetase
VNIVALQTARRCSKSVPKKNIMSVKGAPLFMHNCWHAQETQDIQYVYISTDDPFIKNYVKECPFNDTIRIIDRPKELCKDTSSHQDTILHGLEYIENDMGKKVDILVILLGNCKGAYTEDLDRGIKYLKRHKDVDSIMSVSKFNMFNPMRSFKIENNNLVNMVDLKMFDNISRKNEKNSMGDVYFFNGSFWICSRQALFNKSTSVFPWLGNKIVPLIQEEGLMEVDALWQTKML